ncbi:hypothetical protein [Schleiferilactobacillus shenzhenensis]|uniref:Uncharacterized protein n=1 Tax=Schleiferilactobacillus shenzhenensis LY-73 TaxID=1231336 RepID=U4TNS9_9LACO|nr:hypothetical protein [Schleiferilactobacillus shenzhenensis]ERL66546.1 hypothetical protein L248_0225 [Schleiferilactobacillus shenzhenensis LY-73]
MKHKLAIGIILLASVLIVLLGWHKATVERLYQDFEIQQVLVTAKDESIPISSNLSMTLIRQGVQHRNQYTAVVLIHAKRRGALSISQWYLDEGSNRQPNQFLEAEINGKKGKVVNAGDNQVIVRAVADPTKHVYRLAVVVHYHPSKYRIVTFTR